MLHTAVIKIAVLQSALTEGLLQGADEVTPPYLIAATLEIIHVFRTHHLQGLQR